jgi:hypothetical protein
MPDVEDSDNEAGENITLTDEQRRENEEIALQRNTDDGERLELHEHQLAKYNDDLVISAAEKADRGEQLTPEEHQA